MSCDHISLQQEDVDTLVSDFSPDYHVLEPSLVEVSKFTYPISSEHAFIYSILSKLVARMYLSCVDDNVISKLLSDCDSVLKKKISRDIGEVDQ